MDNSAGDAMMREAWDPATQPQRLYEIAAQIPKARPAVAVHPNAYEGLLGWLSELGDPAVDQALRQRGAAVAEEAAVAARPAAQAARRTPRRLPGAIAATAIVAVVITGGIVWTVSSNSGGEAGSVAAGDPAFGAFPEAAPVEAALAALTERPSTAAWSAGYGKGQTLLYVSGTQLYGYSPDAFSAALSEYGLETMGHEFVGIDAATGEELWAFDPYALEVGVSDVSGYPRWALVEEGVAVVALQASDQSEAVLARVDLVSGEVLNQVDVGGGKNISFTKSGLIVADTSTTAHKGLGTTPSLLVDFYSFEDLSSPAMTWESVPDAMPRSNSDSDVFSLITENGQATLYAAATAVPLVELSDAEASFSQGPGFDSFTVVASASSAEATVIVHESGETFTVEGDDILGTSDSGTLLVRAEHALVGYDSATGEERWRDAGVDADKVFDWVSPFLFGDSVVVADDYSFRVLDASDGSELATIERDFYGDVRFQGAGDVLYVALADGRMAAYSVAERGSLKPLWNFALTGNETGTFTPHGLVVDDTDAHEATLWKP
ncbi:PQQ-binding-like beta-propeller repeat protein [Pseudoclavibacter helvolus]|uniref:variant leucine-rich repeat-containing protein n=1 Tax=Pseudoclavibacter helvolus TaxID=255205 RepID=UPI0024AD5F9A|nr:PQQ-binding-like beta-propeller repeat protein [Pseudoclavibacter helvolus]